MHLVREPHSFAITFAELRGTQRSALMDLFVAEDQTIATHILQSQRKENKTVDYTFTVYIPLSTSLTMHQTQTMDSLDLRNVTCTAYDAIGRPVSRNHEWFDTHPMTPSEWLATVGLTISRETDLSM